MTAPAAAETEQGSADASSAGRGAPAVEVRGLRMSYGALEAVRGIDLSIERGEVFALLGPNGAGKTTTVEILEGYRRRTGGEARVLGEDPQSNRRRLKERVGIVLQQSGVPGFLSVREVTAMMAGYYPHPRDVDEVIRLAGLEEAKDRRVLRLSGGQKRRLDLAIALVGDPELLFLDEPTTGFDPSARRAAWDTIRSLAGLGKTIFLTTHFMDEAQALADRVAIIAAGQIVARGTPDSIGTRASSDSVIRFGLPESEAPPDGLGAVRANGRSWQIETSDPTRTLHALTSWAVDHGLELARLEVNRPSLEDVYLELTGSEAKEGAEGQDQADGAQGRSGGTGSGGGDGTVEKR